ncbi:MAG TPA: DUF1501 domain-containing protein [Abditibacteriaceae bacterium]|jgi:uncharacterized protein (DUF1501 family)
MNEWLGCDGSGNAPREIETVPVARRAMLGGALASLVWWAKGKTALAGVAVAPPPHQNERDILVMIFLRGGADGLNLIVPHGDDAYYKNRPTLGVPSPRDKTKNSKDRALDLNGFFGLHPTLAPLKPFYDKGTMALVHACGSFDQSRSHFEAMALMEHGQGSTPGGQNGGWLARHLSSAPGRNDSPLRAVALSNIMPESLRGATQATALNSLDEFRLILPDGDKDLQKAARARQILSSLYDGSDAVSHAGRETLAVLESLRRLDPKNYKPSGGAQYPDSTFGRGLRQVACLIKGDIGLEAACLDHSGPFLWDTHVAQNNLLPAQANDLAQGIAAFARDLDSELNRVTIVAMTEFGRRVAENSGLGTDHGRAGVMFLLGGGIKGGQVYGRWPGLGKDDLEAPGDLRVTADYRDVLGEIVAKRLKNDKAEAIFPGHKARFMGVTA